MMTFKSPLSDLKNKTMWRAVNRNGGAPDILYIHPASFLHPLLSLLLLLLLVIFLQKVSYITGVPTSQGICGLYVT